MATEETTGPPHPSSRSMERREAYRDDRSHRMTDPRNTLATQLCQLMQSVEM